MMPLPQDPRFPCPFCGALGTALDPMDLCDECRRAFNDPRPGEEEE